MGLFRKNGLTYLKFIVFLIGDSMSILALYSTVCHRGF